MPNQLPVQNVSGNTFFQRWGDRIRAYLPGWLSSRPEDKPENIEQNERRPNLYEIANIMTSPEWPVWLGQALNNPDPIIGKHSEGQGVRIYEKMYFEDATIRSAYESVINGVMQFPITIEAASEDDANKEVAEFVRKNILELPNIDDIFENILTTRFYGYTVHEVGYKPVDGTWGLDYIKPRPQLWFTFHKDPPHVLMLRTKWGAWIDGYPVPERKFLYSKYQGKDDNPYGDPIGRTLYWLWYFKKASIKWWGMFNEVYGAPTKLLSYPRGLAPDEQLKVEALSTAIMNNSSLTIPEDVKATLLEAQRTGTVNTFKDYIDLLDGMITRVIKGETLTSGEGASSGFQSLGKQHGHTKSDYVAKDARQLEKAMQPLIQWLVDYNYNGVEKYPRLRVGVEDAEDLSETSDTVLKAQQAGLAISKKWYYNKTKFAQPEDAADTLIPVKATLPAGHGFEFSSDMEPSVFTPYGARKNAFEPDSLASDFSNKISGESFETKADKAYSQFSARRKKKALKIIPSPSNQ